jgi:hypothetical protein
MSGPSENQMHTQPNASDHSQHDLLAIAALADRGATGEEADRAYAQIETCSECAALHADLVNLATATRQLPPIERPRDFRLRPADAQRLRPNLIRRLFGSFGTARDGFSRPLAMGLTTLGLAGLMLGILPSAIPLGGATGGAGAAATDAEHVLEAPANGFLPAASAEGPAPAAGGAAPDAEQPNDLQHQYDRAQVAADNARPMGAGELQLEDGAGPVSIASEPQGAGQAFAEDSGMTRESQLIVISGTLLIVGLGLFALRWTSRRFGG